MSLHVRQPDSMHHHRPSHGGRTAESQAAFLLPYLRPGMTVLDMGCGPCSITVGLTAAVAPGRTVGIDLDPLPLAGIDVVVGDVMSLPFPDATFDAMYASALLQHLPDPLGALREARRVARPGAVIGLVDADWDGELLYPTNGVLRRSMDVARKIRKGTSPFVGKRLRHLLNEAGFCRTEGSARVLHYGTADETRAFGAFTASLFRHRTTVERAVAEGWSTVEALEEMSQAWIAWGECSGAFVARFWCEAIGWAD
jgi:ubiquinone/menaquinone biosynthesis C-methylase UbiE